MKVMDFSGADCKNCYKCVRTCEVKAIKVEDHKARIMEKRCIACGHCLSVCPQNARDIKSHIQNVQNAINSGKKVVASIAPAYKAYFKDSGQFIAGLKALGISIVEETTLGAAFVSQAYENYIRNTDKTRLITTCCPSTVRLVEIYYPELLSNMIPIVSPMLAHGKLIKEKYADAYTVFIGPCMSKICEAIGDREIKDIDAVVTFDEVIAYMKGRDIDYEQLEKASNMIQGAPQCNTYPIPGGVLKSIEETLVDKEITSLKVDGTKECMEVLELLRQEEIDDVCIEMNICRYSCIGGPGAINQGKNIHVNMQRFKKAIKESQTIFNEYADLKDKVDLRKRFSDKSANWYIPSEEEIAKVLNKMSKLEEKDELNCGACGYETCRDKAVAVLNGMSQIDMCMAYTRGIAERLSTTIFHNSPNAIFIIDKECKVIDINPRAESLFNCNKKEVMSQSISRLMDKTAFEKALQDQEKESSDKVELPAYDLIAYRNMIYLEKQKALLIIFTNVTKEEKRKRELIELKSNMLDVTQSIVDKQMRTAQEIASLLGETTAETKVAIMDLKKVLQEEKS